MPKLLPSSALDDQGADFVVEGVGGEELLDGEVHAVTPVVTGIGGDVDALGILVGQAQLLVDAHPVLEGDETEH